MLGHARLETTQIYTHVNIKALADVHARTHPHGPLPRTKSTATEIPSHLSHLEPPEPPTDNPPNPGTPPDISGGGPANPSGPEDSPCGGSGEVLGVPPAMRVAIFHTCPMPLAVQIPPGLDGNSPESERISRPGCPTQTPPDISSNCLNTNGMNAKNQPAKSVHVAYYGYRWLDPLTGRWPSRDPFEEEGGVNLHAGCSNDFVNLIDDLGNQVWAFSGIRAHFLQTNRNYVRDELSRASNGKIKPVNTKNTKPNSELHNDPSASDLAFLPGLLPLAETQLDEEAKRKAAESVKEGEFCKSCSNRKTSIAMVMVAPKRHPQDLPTTECCNIAYVIYFDRNDIVPQTGIFGGWGNYWHGKNVSAWEADFAGWHNHNFDNNFNLKNVEGNGEFGGAAIDLQKVVRNFEGKKDKVFVCHSQGCNIALETLIRACNKKK